MFPAGRSVKTVIDDIKGLKDAALPKRYSAFTLRLSQKEAGISGQPMPFAEVIDTPSESGAIDGGDSLMTDIASRRRYCRTNMPPGSPDRAILLVLHSRSSTTSSTNKLPGTGIAV